jgi:putative aldouronate transport system substrate-binding protein
MRQQSPRPRQRRSQQLPPWGAGTVTVPNPPQILFNPQDPEFARVIQAFVDGLAEILRGNQPLTRFDQLVADWRKNGGDQIRAEYEQAFASAQA